jgi:hypothetical protein
MHISRTTNLLAEEILGVPKLPYRSIPYLLLLYSLGRISASVSVLVLYVYHRSHVSASCIEGYSTACPLFQFPYSTFTEPWIRRNCLLLGSDLSSASTPISTNGVIEWPCGAGCVIDEGMTGEAGRYESFQAVDK